MFLEWILEQIEFDEFMGILWLHFLQNYIFFKLNFKIFTMYLESFNLEFSRINYDFWKLGIEPGSCFVVDWWWRAFVWPNKYQYLWNILEIK